MTLKWQVNGCEPIVKELDVFDKTEIKLCIEPSADVVEVKHGEWQKTNPMTDTVECSLCHYQIISEELITPFCPWCGADMRGENK